MLLIGSRAARYHFPDARKPKDYDFIATTDEVDAFLSNHDYVDTSHHPHKRRARLNLDGQYVSCEFDLTEHVPSSWQLYELNITEAPVCHDRLLKTDYFVASPETLYLLKRSHITFNIHWDKSIFDFHFLRQHIDTNKLPSWWQEVFTLRYNEVRARINKKQFDFDVSNSEFFRKSERFVSRIVEHDSLHYATCFGDKPLFLSAKDDVSKAALSGIKMMRMSDATKLMMIQEETMALSLERYVIPALMKNQPYNAKHAYRKTAGKMVHNYLPEFLRLFAADHFLDILDLKVDYVALCLERHLTLKDHINGNI